jgi:hypothetical protein
MLGTNNQKITTSNETDQNGSKVKKELKNLQIWFGLHLKELDLLCQYQREREEDIICMWLPTLIPVQD